MFALLKSLSLKLTVLSSPRFAAARAKPTIVVGRFCGRGMGVLREGKPPFLEVVLWFVSVNTEMNEKAHKRVFCVFAQNKSLHVHRGYGSTKALPYGCFCSSGIRVVGAPTPTGVKEILNFSNKHRIFGDLADTVLLIARYDFFLILFKLTFEIFGDLQRKYG